MLDSFLRTISSIKNKRRDISNAILSPLFISGLIIQINYLASSSPIYIEHVPPILDSMIKLRLVEEVSPVEETLIKLNRLSMIGFSLLITFLPLDFISSAIYSREKRSRGKLSFLGKVLAILSPCLFSCVLGYLVSAAFIKHVSTPTVFQYFVYPPTIIKLFLISISLSMLAILTGLKLINRSSIYIGVLRLFVVVFWNLFAWL